MAIVINGSGTVTGLSVGGLPDGTVDAGTLATNSVDSAELIDGAVDDSHIAALASSKLTGALPAISGAALTGITTGKVLQVVQATSSTSTDVAVRSGFNDLTGASASITPSATSSKILVIFNAQSWMTLKAAEANLQVVRGSTVLTQSRGYAISSPSYDWQPHHLTEVHLDSPSTTSATTYKIKVEHDDYSYGGGTWRINAGSTNSMSLTLLEIGA